MSYYKYCPQLLEVKYFDQRCDHLCCNAVWRGKVASETAYCHKHANLHRPHVGNYNLVRGDKYLVEPKISADEILLVQAKEYVQEQLLKRQRLQAQIDNLALLYGDHYNIY